MIIADYTFYVEEYGGELIPSASFTRYINKANYILKRMIQNRNVDSYFENQYNLALCAIADYNYDTPKITKSESLGDYSVTYGSSSYDFDICEIVINYLGNTGLLCGGVICN